MHPSNLKSNKGFYLKDGRSLTTFVDKERVDKIHEIDSNDSYNTAAISGKEKRNVTGVFHWEREDVLMLIRLHSEKEPIFNKPGIKKKDVWAMIADEFQAKGFNVTSGQCEQKWKNITKNYRDTVDHNYFSNIHKTCPYFKELAAIYPYDPKDKQNNFISYLNHMSNSVSQPQTVSRDLQNGLSAIPSTNTVTTSVNNSNNGYFCDLPTNICVSDNQNASSEHLVQTSIKQEVLDSVELQPPACSLMSPSPLTASNQQPNISTSQSHSNQQITNFTPTSSLPLVSSFVNEEPVPSLSSMILQYSPQPLNNEYIRLPSQEPQTCNMRHQQEVRENSNNSLHVLKTPAQSQLSSVPNVSTNSSQVRKRFHDNNLTLSNSSAANNNQDYYSQRRKCLRRSSFTPNNTLDMLKQMNEERRREHKELISTLKQHHREYLKQEEMNQSLLSALIGHVSKQ
ncbi:Hypothetical predicted protein [Octopus vulgaris]|uniref:Myb-like domain-containing protein n=1 Tax=Octopus vulgaris TaxID=6645 RepID=A0AA36F103_OCTVU|nr:Hypothetical predicted protein [Octopus vulgaris]